MNYLTYDWILQGDDATEQGAYDLANSDLLGECETSMQSIGHADYIDTVRGVGIYYDYAADYYFFTDESSDN